MPPAAPFLNVQNSFTGKVWRDRLGPLMTAQAAAIRQRTGVPEIVARVAAGRGIEARTAEMFFNPSLKTQLPDPSCLTAMDTLTVRLADAVMRLQPVAIFGDYDVDGACASALLARYLRQLGVSARIYIPDRIFEGYGPNVEAIRTLKGEGAALLVSVDCGTTSDQPFAEARRLGLDVLVIDHHQANETLPEVVALVNPNRQDDLSGLGYLCATGLVFVTLVALNRELRRRGWFSPDRPEPDLMPLLDLVALATVADVVPLIGLNRVFVARGMLALRHRHTVGLRALMDVAGLDGPPQPWHLGFLLGPRINAGGRIGQADLGARLLMTEDVSEAMEISAQLHQLNQERQAVEQAILAEAEAEVRAALGHQDQGSVVITAGKGWHPGVLGLIAARLKETFNRPAFALSFTAEGQGTGSGRSISGVDLGRMVRLAVDQGLLTKGGGHAMAAGLSLQHQELGRFRAFAEEQLAAEVAKARADSCLRIDGALSAGAATPDLMTALEKAGPFGAGNPEPVFVFPAHTLSYADVVGDAHVRVRLRSGNGDTVSGVAFRSVGKPLGDALLHARGKSLHVAASLALNRYRGNENVELRLVDAADPLLI